MKRGTVSDLWKPFEGSPQEEAYHSLADEVFYGGAAGGGKSDMLLGLAFTAHQNSIIFRREYPQLAGLEERAREILRETDAVYNSMSKVWRDLPDGRRLEFGAVQHEKDKYKFQGRPHDLKAFDELPNFTESQYRYLTGWARTPTPGQRVRVVATGNPPTEDQGLWIIERFAPWLDPDHPDFPEEPGKLRWYAMIDGEEVEMPNRDEFEHDGEIIKPKSRTFFPASVEDNPYYMQTGYKAQLQSLPEPLRSQLLFGDFSVGLESDPWQVLPTKWVKDAMERWRNDSQPDIPLTQLGVDVARLGSDKIVYAPRYAHWYAPLIRHEKQDTMETAEQVKEIYWDDGIAVIDVIGVGAGTYDRLKMHKTIAGRTRAFDSSRAAKDNDGNYKKDRSGKLTFTNMRAWAWWYLREALHPETGDNISLPYDKRLLQDLTAPKWSLRTNGIKIESKEDIKKRLGRSPDDGDAIVYATVPIGSGGLPDQPIQKSRFTKPQQVGKDTLEWTSRSGRGKFGNNR